MNMETMTAMDAVRTLNASDPAGELEDPLTMPVEPAPVVESPRWPERPRRAVAAGAILAALAVGAVAGGAVGAGVSQVGGPARVTLDTSSYEDGSERALVRLVVPAGVSQVKVLRPLTRGTGGRVVSFVVGYCRAGGVCEEGRR